MPDLVPIYTASNVMHAELLRAELEDHDIASYLVNEAMSQAIGALPPGWSTSPRVLVATEDAAKAREIALEFDEQLIQRAGVMEKPEPVRPVIEPDDWPRCLMCGQRRMVGCRICETAGTDFPRAYDPSAERDDEQPLMVVCPTCDEPFQARFYKTCANCGYEFDNGIAIARPTGRPEEADDSSFRLWLVIGGMVLVFVVCGVYLWWLMEK